MGRLRNRQASRRQGAPLGDPVMLAAWCLVLGILALAVVVFAVTAL